LSNWPYIYLKIGKLILLPIVSQRIVVQSKTSQTAAPHSLAQNASFGRSKAVVLDAQHYIPDASTFNQPCQPQIDRLWDVVGCIGAFFPPIAAHAK
jgi:hypothetical protein